MSDILVIAAIVALCVGLIMCTISIMMIKHFNEMKATLINVVNEHVDSARIAKLERDREIEISRLLSDIIIDLAHAEDPNCLRWKLHSVRRVEELLKTSAYYDNSIYNWIVSCLTCSSMDVNASMLSTLRNFIKELFMLDYDQRKNLDETLEIIAQLQSDIVKAENGHDELFGKLKESVRKLNFNLPIIDTAPRVSHYDVKAEGFEAVLKTMQDMETEEQVEMACADNKKEEIVNEAECDRVPQSVGGAKDASPAEGEGPAEEPQVGDAEETGDAESPEESDPEGRSDVIVTDGGKT